MKVIMLAGGMGTRLKSVVPDIPKPMATVCGRPFLEILLTNAINQGADEIILSVGYRHEVIRDYFDDCFLGVSLRYVVEDEPLGTGGALRKAIESCDPQEPVFVLNADTFFHLDLEEMYNAYLESNADVGMALKLMEDASRYGCVSINNNSRLVERFEEKSLNASGLINAGIYLLRPQLFKRFDLPVKFSLEEDFFAQKIFDIDIFPFVSESYFIDIGIPEDYERAQSEMESFCR